MRTIVPRLCLLLALLPLGPGATAVAQVSAEEAARLGGPELTPVGAERAGNAAGTIPAWTGGLTEPPADYVPGGRLVNPFPDDGPTLTISAENLAEHEGHLTPGQQALLRAYPDTWRMPVYETRRTAAYPDWVYEAIKANATQAEVITTGRGGVRGARISSPFPIPSRGVEVVWNHNLRWRGVRVKRTNGQAPVTPRGFYRVVLSLDDLAFPYGAQGPSRLRRDDPNLLFAAKSKVVQPGLLTGDGLLVLDSVNHNEAPRRSWSYVANIRRVFRNPFIGYDVPALDTDGLRTVDEFDMYNGAPDRFRWTLVGKQEIYVPYNAYALDAAGVGYDDILDVGHIHPELARYELHRVWVVEGRLKPDARHIYSRRVFYIDEDSWQILVADAYDRNGRLWRVAEAHVVNYYQVPVLWTTLEVFHDLESRRYLAAGLDNGRNPYRFLEGGDPREFTPSALNFYVR